MKITSNYFYGHEISEYGREHGFVDYRTLAAAFDAVLSNDLMGRTEAAGLGYWEQESGFVDNSEELEELREQLEELEECEQYTESGKYYTDENGEELTEEEAEKVAAKIEELREKIEELEEEEENQPEIFQYYIVTDNGAEILKEAGEIVFYNSELDLYIWGVTHWGTAWDYVLTNIRIEAPEEC